MDTKCVVVIPAYEPDEKMISLLKELKAKTDYDLLVVDDGSALDKKEIFEEAKGYAVVLKHDVNKGKGRAIKTALEYIQNNYDNKTVLVTVDADGQHTVADTIKIVDATIKNQKNLIIGGRIFKGKVPLKNKTGNYITRFVYMLFTGVKVRDTQTGLRAYGYDLIPFMKNIKGDRYEYEMNVLMECAKEDVPITEVPIEAVYIDDNESSHFDTVKDSFRIYKHIIGYGAKNIVCLILSFLVYCFAAYFLLNTSIIRAVIVANLLFEFTRIMFLGKKAFLSGGVQYGLMFIIKTALIVIFARFNSHIIIDKIIVDIIFLVITFFINNIKIASETK